MEVEVQSPVASPSDSKKELKACNAYVATDLNGTATTMFAQPAVEMPRVRSCGSFHEEEGLGTEDKISGVAPSGRLTVERTDVGDVPLGTIPISSTATVDGMLGNRGSGTCECPTNYQGDYKCQKDGCVALQAGCYSAANAATGIEDVKGFDSPSYLIKEVLEVVSISPHHTNRHDKVCSVGNYYSNPQAEFSDHETVVWTSIN